MAKPAPIYRSNLIFRALPVPAGESAVVFRFEPKIWRAALYIGLSLWIIALLAGLWIRRRGPQPSIPETSSSIYKETDNETGQLC